MRRTCGSARRTARRRPKAVAELEIALAGVAGDGARARHPDSGAPLSSAPGRLGRAHGAPRLRLWRMHAPAHCFPSGAVFNALTDSRPYGESGSRTGGKAGLIEPRGVGVADLIRFVLGNFTLTFLVIGLVASGIALLRARKPLTAPVVVEALFAYFLLFSIGVSFLYNFVFHTFFGEMAATLHRLGGQPVPGRGRVREPGLRGGGLSRLPAQLRSAARRGGRPGAVPAGARRAAMSIR